MASNQSTDGMSVSFKSTWPSPGFSPPSIANRSGSGPVHTQAIEALKKLETDAAVLQREAHNMEQAELLRNQQALQRRLQLVGRFHQALQRAPVSRTAETMADM